MTGDRFVGKLSVVGQPTRPAQPLILPRERRDLSPTSSSAPSCKVECMLAAGLRPSKRDVSVRLRSLELWAVTLRGPTSYWGLCLLDSNISAEFAKYINIFTGRTA